MISLGPDCQVAANLQTFQLRQEAYPFDWLVTEDFDSVIDAIEDDFQHWLDPEFLEYRGYYVYNNLYHLAFVHDFPVLGKNKISPEGEQMTHGTIDPFYFHHLQPSMVEKFQRRIDRLRALLHSNETVVFVRAYATRHSANRFVQLMQTQFPDLNFTLVVVGQERFLNASWNIDHVTNVYRKNDKNATHAWWWNQNSWRSILKSVKLL